MFKFLTILILSLFINYSAFGEENLLTLKQQIDRLQRDVNDLSKLIFQNNNNLGDLNNSNQQNQESNNISAFDMRIYDLESDIKNLYSNIEDLIFQIEELKKIFEDMRIEIDTKLISNNNLSNNENDIVNEADQEESDTNTLGTLKINSEDLSEQTETLEEKDNLEISEKLNPDEQFQLAFDMLRGQKFEEAKEALKEFINENSENNLSGSAHYWLGEIYLLQKDYREAAIVFAEGYRKYPSSVKAPDNLYKLADSLSKINKIEEACNTLEQFIKKHQNHKLINKTNKKIASLNCE